MAVSPLHLTYHAKGAKVHSLVISTTFGQMSYPIKVALSIGPNCKATIEEAVLWYETLTDHCFPHIYDAAFGLQRGYIGCGISCGTAFVWPLIVHHYTFRDVKYHHVDTNSKRVRLGYARFLRTISWCNMMQYATTTYSRLYKPSYPSPIGGRTKEMGERV